MARGRRDSARACVHSWKERKKKPAKQSVVVCLSAGYGMDLVYAINKPAVDYCSPTVPAFIAAYALQRPGFPPTL
jgi:hypothetical protein